MVDTENSLIEIDSTLHKMKDEFNAQYAAMASDNQSFHNAMIELSSKYPEHKELVQFIVLVNDKLETKHQHYSDLASNAFNDLIDIKLQLIASINRKVRAEMKTKESATENKMGFFKKFFTTTKFFSEIKVVLISIAAILFALLVFFAPDILLTTLKALASILT